MSNRKAESKSPKADSSKKNKAQNVVNIIKKQKANLNETSDNQKLLKQKLKKMDETMKLIINSSLCEDEKMMHCAFNEYLASDLSFSGKDLTKEKAKHFMSSYPDDEALIHGYKEILMVYCEEELQYQIKAMQDSYKAFQDIINIKEEDMFTEIMKRGHLDLKDREIKKFLHDKNKKHPETKFNRKGPKHHKEEQKQ